MHPPQYLLIEDVPEMRDWLAALLTEAGLKLSGTAANVWEARLELNRRKPDWVLLDEVLPGESAFDFIAEIQDAGAGVILMTSMDPSSSDSRALPAGVSARVFKPDWEKPAREEKERLRKAILDASNRDLVKTLKSRP